MTAQPGGDSADGGSGSVAAMSSQGTDGGARRPGVVGTVPRWLAVLAAIILVAGLATLVVFGVRYAEARSAQEVASEREAASDVAAQVIVNAFSFDHRNVDDSLEQLAEASTGEFLTEQEQYADDVRTRVVEQKAVTTATVSHTAVETLDLEAGDAAVLVVFTAHSEREGQDDITGRQAMRVDLTREDDTWKADAVNQVGVTVPVGESSQSVQELNGPEEQDDPATEEESTPAPTTSAGR
ncbi:hypothetical protein CEY15_05560 [Dietzia natronolimnaea]|uniref:Mce-associated membrane protein n=2 Tax=Dietziaceae TaxID=85029 RepID=A0A2A2WS10_9ACTN|nr:hypothetical protein ES5_12997 [Dietzia cinnamea P4]OAV77658.1 hypothetical protein AYO52_03155 [Dietzia sp. 111N12-1]PAY24019.1 hypothetical protein CEY15_05560 [Dietzia natronolimnaea]